MEAFVYGDPVSVWVKASVPSGPRMDLWDHEEFNQLLPRRALHATTGDQASLRLLGLCSGVEGMN